MVNELNWSSEGPGPELDIAMAPSPRPGNDTLTINHLRLLSLGSRGGEVRHWPIHHHHHYYYNYYFYHHYHYYYHH